MKRALLSLSLLLPASPVWAAICSEPSPGMGRTEISAISQTIPRDVPVDTVIYTRDILKPDVRVTCSSLSNYNMSVELLRAGAATPTGSNVYPTGIPGIGMRLLWHHPSHIPNPPAGGFYLGSFATRSLGWGLKEFFVPHAFKLELIKTGPISSGVSKDLEAVIYYSNAKVHSVHLRQLQYTVVNSGCKVTSSQLHQVDLLDVKASAFTHRGAFAGAKAFHIDLLCDKGA